jgi:hypothetical protein
MSIDVCLEDRLRLAGALLAAGEWPEVEQKLKPYKPHRVAESARKYFAPARAHPAVQAAQAQAGQGEGLAQFFTQSLQVDSPEAAVPELVGFVAATEPEKFWAETDADWQAAVKEAREVLARADLEQFLSDLFGPLSLALALVPNLMFPGQKCFALEVGNRLIIYAPPPLAWGSSPPWRYNERADEVLAMVSQTAARQLVERHLPAGDAAVNQAEALGLAAAVLFLRQAEGEAAGDQFMVIQKKTRGWKGLPGVVSALGEVLAARRAGQWAHWPDYLPGLVAPLEHLTG